MIFKAASLIFLKQISKTYGRWKLKKAWGILNLMGFNLVSKTEVSFKLVVNIIFSAFQSKYSGRLNACEWDWSHNVSTKEEPTTSVRIQRPVEHTLPSSTERTRQEPEDDFMPTPCRVSQTVNSLIF